MHKNVNLFDHPFDGSIGQQLQKAKKKKILELNEAKHIFLSNMPPSCEVAERKTI